MSTAKLLKRLDILGIWVSRLESYKHAEDIIVQQARGRQKTFCVAINPEKIYSAQKDEYLRELINSADIHICDGIGAAIAAKVLYGEKIARITGVQLFLGLMSCAEKEGLSVFLLGAKPESNEGAYNKLIQMHPDLQIAGRQDGYFKDDREVVQKINNSGADMLFVALGSPRQEFWITEHREAICAPFCLGIGGALDVLSGNAKWAPKIFRKTGTEFLYRLITDPKRWRRQLVLPKFALMVLKERIYTKTVSQDRETKNGSS
ncbi:WecB/TagA/CpsF family glycosyltransferase [Candidatus Omnitrophota bacterium]